MNGKVRAVAYAYIAICGAAIAVGLVVCIGLAFSRDPSSARALLTIGTPFVILSVIYFIPGVAGGIGVLRGKPWARTLLIVLSVLVLFLFPVGTLFGGYAIWVLHGAATSSSAPPPVDRAPAPRPSPQPVSPEQQSRYLGLLKTAAGVASAFVVVIGTGFRLTRQPAPPEIDALYYPAIVVLVALIVIGIRAWLGGPDSDWPNPARWFADRRQMAKEREQWEEEKRRRLAELAADPVKQKYIERAQRGESWSDAQIDYNENLNRLATCVHLQPIEQEMRMTGIDVRLTAGTTVRADCCVDPVALGQRFTLAPSVRYAELPIYDRSLLDPPVALLTCDACRSVIDLVERSRAKLDTPWFPDGASEEIAWTAVGGSEPS